MGALNERDILNLPVISNVGEKSVYAGNRDEDSIMTPEELQRKNAETMMIIKAERDAKARALTDKEEFALDDFTIPFSKEAEEADALADNQRRDAIVRAGVARSKAENEGMPFTGGQLADGFRNQPAPAPPIDIMGNPGGVSAIDRIAELDAENPRPTMSQNRDEILDSQRGSMDSRNAKVKAFLQEKFGGEENAKKRALLTNALLRGVSDIAQHGGVHGSSIKPNLDMFDRERSEIMSGDTPKGGESGLRLRSKQENMHYERFIKDPRYKKTLGALQTMDDVMGIMANPSGTGDIAMLFSFIKNLDESVVRASEVELFGSALSAKDRVKVWGEKIKSGYILSPKQRQSIGQIIISQAKKRMSRFENYKKDHVKRVRLDNDMAVREEATYPDLSNTISIFEDQYNKMVVGNGKDNKENETPTALYKIKNDLESKYYVEVPRKSDGRVAIFDTSVKPKKFVKWADGKK